ncbi:MAG: dihydroneopterin aldolase [Candidatus Pelagibacter sp. TMED263]|nr:MAG: dihydroneopterin aldolase [Candidatus Pelagibacter sp. TMED263]|tara:strand:+ start:18 stop:413 length:396 start_codon:yes stop_codon:yes gene_type:complete
MKIIKLKLKERYKYKRKIIIKNLILNISIGIHNFEKRKKQRVRFNIEVVTDPNIMPNNKDLSTILNYEEIINKIKILVKKQHHELIEDLAENIFKIIFKNRLAKKMNIKIEKLDIVKNSESVGIEFSKKRL